MHHRNKVILFFIKAANFLSGLYVFILLVNFCFGLVWFSSTLFTIPINTFRGNPVYRGSLTQTSLQGSSLPFSPLPTHSSYWFGLFYFKVCTTDWYSRGFLFCINHLIKKRKTRFLNDLFQSLYRPKNTETKMHWYNWTLSIILITL